MRKRKGTIAASAAILAALALASPPAATAAGGRTVSGNLSCVSGKRVSGVFVNANSGGGGFASITSRYANAASWQYHIPNNGSYFLAVGCGGNDQNWDSTSYSKNYSGNAGGMLCFDLVYQVPIDKQYRCTT